VTPGGKALAITSIGVSMTALDTTIVNVARDTIARDFAGSEAAASWVMSGYSIVFAAVLLTSGRVADRYGRKRVYTTGLLLFIAASASCGLAWNLPVLVAARALQAVGGALLAPAALALVLPEFPMERRSAAIGVWGAIGSIGAAGGPTLGSFIVNGWGWRSAFLINVPLGLAAFVLGRTHLRESRDPNAVGIPDPLSIVTGVGAVGLMALAITKGNEWGYVSGRGLACFVAAVVLVPVFLWRCRVARLPVLDLSLFRHNFFAVGNASTLLFTIPFYGQLVANISFLQRVWHYSVLRAGLASSASPIAAIVAAPLAGRLLDRVGIRRMTMIGVAQLATALVLLAARATESPAYVAHFLPSLVLIGSGLGVLIPTLQTASVKFLPPDRYAMGSAFFSTIRQLGAALAVAITVALLTRELPTMTNYRTAWSIHLIGALAVGALMLGAFRTPTKTAPSAAVPSSATPLGE
jgi:EmrB/QacA subfamily drug resistance transporter